MIFVKFGHESPKSKNAKLKGLTLFQSAQVVEEGRKRKEKRFENRRGQMRGVRTLCEKLSREKYRRRKRKSSSAGKLRFMLSLCQSVPAQSDHPVRERSSRKSIQRAAALNYIFHNFIPRGKQYVQKDNAA